MPTIIVAVYHTLDNTDAVRHALEAEGISHDDVRISDYVDPVVRNAPASIEKPGGFLYWLGGIPQVDVEAYREAVARGRTIVAVRTPGVLVERVATILEQFEPIDIGLPETLPERERVLAEETGALPPRAADASTTQLPVRLRVRRYVIAV
jgi:hypothetical protein